MLYNLIIVDDEKNIREGLASIIDWHSLGFTVVGKFADGKEAIESLSKMQVHVILSDIKMTAVSGLKIAEYVYNNMPQIKVVLVSGYKEFDFAKQAMMYNVFHYLLKPTQINEINKVFSDLKQKLDEEYKERRKQDEINEFIKEQFFQDMYTGALKDSYEVSRRLKITDNPIDEYQICLIELIIQDYQEYLHNIWVMGKDELFIAIRNFINVENENFFIHPIYKSGERIPAFVLFKKNLSESTAISDLKEFLKNLTMDMKTLLNLSITIEIGNIYDNIYSYQDKKKSSFDEIEKADFSEIEESLLIRNSKEYINNNYAKDLSLDEVAKQVFVNPVYLSRIFKVQTGENFSDYLIRVRMTKAIELLKQPQYKVYEVSEMIGYSSVKYFYKLFKKYIGYTPSEYRLNLLNGGEK